jgi:4,5-dihydroxyphthalate decarboxylase
MGHASGPIWSNAMGPLKIALGSYGLTRPLKEGRIKPARMELQFVEVEPITAGMRRMVRADEFDICEMAWTTYLCAKDVGKPVTAIPVFVTRNFHHWAIFKNLNARIRKPKDLEGKRVAVNRGYTVTTGVWARGILASEYGVDLDKITWICTDDEHVAEFKAPGNVKYAERGGPSALDMLKRGEVEAAIGDLGTNLPETVEPLIPDAQLAGFAWYKKTGIYPMNHGVTIHDRVLKEAPWVATELFAAVQAAKTDYLKHLNGRDLTRADDQAIALGRGIGGDPFPFGVEANRKAIEAIIRFAYEQKAIKRSFTIDELFAKELTGA